MTGARRYRRKPDEVEAIQYTGDNALGVATWCNARIRWVEGVFERRFEVIDE